MLKNVSPLGWLAISGVLFATSFLARESVAEGWEAVKNEPAPSRLANEEVGIGDAVTWALLSGALVGVARMAVKRALVRPVVR